MPTVYYIVPDYNVSSWGIGMLYCHVRLLNRNGIQAFVLHHKKPFKCSWFESDTPILYLDDPSFAVKERDILVVPELSAAEANPHGNGQCRKIVFVQNSFILLRAMERALTYDELGYKAAMVAMPHMKDIIETHFGVRASVIPPVVAPYFFIDKDDLQKERKKNIVLFPKAAYKDLGHVDYDILIKLLKRRLGVGKNGLLDRIGGRLGRGASNWKLIELEGKTHRQVAGIMKDSAFFINVNTLEGFNVTVTEAMAAGCVPVCYEAYGGRDFLEDGKNAYVFPNNYIHPLVDKLFELIDTYAEVQDELSGIRAHAYDTAARYGEEEAEKALTQFFRPLLD